MISVQTEDFDVGFEYQRLREQSQSDGAIVTFSGLVRDFNADGEVSGLSIEHYPGMTEKSLENITQEARKRWELGQVRIIHRVGDLSESEQIVFVGVSAKHRQSAFEAAQFMMDYLKMNAPFWKKEATVDGMRWVDVKSSDELAVSKWLKK